MDPFTLSHSIGDACLLNLLFSQGAVESLKVALGGSVATAGPLTDCPFQGDSAHNTGPFLLYIVHTSYCTSLVCSYYISYCTSLVCSYYYTAYCTFLVHSYYTSLCTSLVCSYPTSYCTPHVCSYPTSY